MKRLKGILLLVTFSISIIGYNMEVHYCGGEITDISLIGNSHCTCDSKKEKECHTEVEKTCHIPCDSQEESDNSERDCCETENISNSFDDVYSSSEVTVEQVIIISSLFDHNLFISKKIEGVSNYVYQTPLLYYDVPILVQSFLI